MISPDNRQVSSVAVESSLRSGRGARSNNLLLVFQSVNRPTLVVDALPLRQTRRPGAGGPGARPGAHFVSVVAAGRQYRRRPRSLRACATAARKIERKATCTAQVIQRLERIGKSACHLIDVVEKVRDDVSI
jgi:hypothetical protein